MESPVVVAVIIIVVAVIAPRGCKWTAERFDGCTCTLPPERHCLVSFICGWPQDQPAGAGAGGALAGRDPQGRRGVCVDAALLKVRPVVE